MLCYGNRYHAEYLWEYKWDYYGFFAMVRRQIDCLAFRRWSAILLFIFVRSLTLCLLNKQNWTDGPPFGELQVWIWIFNFFTSAPAVDVLLAQPWYRSMPELPFMTVANSTYIERCLLKTKKNLEKSSHWQARLLTMHAPVMLVPFGFVLLLLRRLSLNLVAGSVLSGPHEIGQFRRPLWCVNFETETIIILPAKWKLATSPRFFLYGLLVFRKLDRNTSVADTLWGNHACFDRFWLFSLGRDSLTRQRFLIAQTDL